MAKGLYHCSRCKQHFYDAEATAMHIKDKHKGEGDVLRHPTKRELLVKNEQQSDRIEALELNIISLKGAQVTHLALIEELEADLMDKEAECRFLRGECNMLRAKLEKAVEALREIEEDCKLRADPTGLVPIGRGAWIMLTEALALIEKEQTDE